LKSLAELAPAGRDKAAAKVARRVVARKVARDQIAAHLGIIAVVAVISFPLYYAFVISTQSMDQAISRPPLLLPSVHAVSNYVQAWVRADMGRLLLNSLVVAGATAAGKIVLSLLSAFAIVYFDFRLKGLVFWMIFVTLMLPVPIRIVPTYQVISDLGWLNTYTGLTVPLIASATGTFLLRQFFRTVPAELAEAAQLDGAGPMRFFWSILLPNSVTNLAALFVVLFISGWNEYLWPLMITTSAEMRVVVVGIQNLLPNTGTDLPEWNVVMAGAMMALLPPVLVVLGLQRWFVQGLLGPEK
jgi:ABC-type sugar transport system, permease component